MIDKTTILRTGFLIVGLGLAAIPKCYDPGCSYNRMVGHAAHTSQAARSNLTQARRSAAVAWTCPLCAGAAKKSNSVQ